MSFVIFSLVALIITLITLSVNKNKRRNELLSRIPTPSRLPLVNHAGYFFNKQPEVILQNLVKFAEELGSVWWTKIPGSTQIFVHDPKIIEIFLTSQKLITKSSEYDFLLPWMGTGLLTSTGQKWHQRRKIITPAFHFKTLEDFVDVMEKQGEIFIEKLSKLQGQEVDIFPLVSLYALDVICETAMGFELCAQTNSESEYVKAVNEMTHILFMRFFDAVKRIQFTYQFTKMYRREKYLIKVLHEFTNKVIKERQKSIRENKFEIKRKLAFLDLLLQAKADGKPLDDEGIREEVDTFMFEGHDTTTSGIAFALLNFAKHPEMQLQVYEECRDVFGDKKSLTMQDLNQLSFLELFIKESLRLYPSVPFIGRYIIEEINVGDYIFPEGVTLDISPFFMGRDKKIFSDPLKFDPLRFVNNEAKNPFNYIPFSAGMRNCIGQKFAVLEMKSILSKIVRNFEISVRKENEDPTLIAQLVLRSKNGVILNFKKRNNF